MREFTCRIAIKPAAATCFLLNPNGWPSCPVRRTKSPSLPVKLETMSGRTPKKNRPRFCPEPRQRPRDAPPRPCPRGACPALALATEALG
eukprot:667280-Rhodomonas_salina.1